MRCSRSAGSIRRLYKNCKPNRYCSVGRWALGAGIADAIQHPRDLKCGGFGGDARRRIVPGEVKGPFARVRIGTILHPAVLLALANDAGLEQDTEIAQPRSVRITGL